jgi:predicted acylesterase/phospholipase RssA/ABC-type phosphate/phosphonate transport system substrate-binding protein
MLRKSGRVIFTAMTAFAFGAVTCPAQSQAPPAIRVGVVAYEDFTEEAARWEEVFAELSRAEPALRFEIAVGTYGDLLHWMEQRLIDVGVVTAGVFAESVHVGLVGDEPEAYRYLATLGAPPAVSKWASQERKQPGYHFRYQTVCVVAKDSPIHNFDDLRDAWRSGGLELLLVHPLSVSGRIAPEFALREAGIAPAPQQVRYTHSHTTSLELLTDGDNSRLEAAFVWDDALRDAPDLADRVRKVNVPALDRLTLPQIAIIARGDHPQLDVLQEKLTGYRDEEDHPMFDRVADWRGRYAPVLKWSEALQVSSLSDLAQSVSLDEIANMLLHRCSAQNQPPRLAVVLSGGGAKCSYQVGAVAAIEEKLADLRRRDSACPLDIDLVVGTSGGAINAAPVAMGITATPEGRGDFRDVWTSLDQRELVRPSWIVRANIGVWFALFFAACWLWIVRRRAPEERWPAAWGIGLLVLAGLLFLLGYVPWNPWSRLGRNHFWHHAWLWGTFGFAACAWSLLALGAAVVTLHGIARLTRRRLPIPHRTLGWTLAVSLFGLPLAQVLTLLFFQETLSSGKGMEEMLAAKMPAIVHNHLARHEKAPLELDEDASDAERIQTLSQGIFDRGLFERDMVITGNCLEQTSSTLPSDLYFYVQESPGSSPPFGPRGIDLRRYPQMLLDVVLGSGTIFPVFPSRTLDDFPEPGERVELIDGGYAHNSPIEAAVLWGATHVILIEATPQRRLPRRNFAENAAAAFVHLHRQTQLVDARSKKQVVVFTLAPEPPYLCVLDFAENLLSASIEDGYEDARLGARFRKELGEPVFTPVERGVAEHQFVAPQ